jgi:hypothetical protein
MLSRIANLLFVAAVVIFVAAVWAQHFLDGRLSAFHVVFALVFLSLGGWALVRGALNASRFVRYGRGGRRLRREYAIGFRQDAVAVLEPVGVVGPCAVTLTCDWPGVALGDVDGITDGMSVGTETTHKGAQVIDVYVPPGVTWTGGLRLALAHRATPQFRSFRLAVKPRPAQTLIRAKLTLEVRGRGAVLDAPADVTLDEQVKGFPVVLPVRPLQEGTRDE